MTTSPKVPKAMQDKFEAIVTLTDAFCAQRLNENYRTLIHSALAALSRKRPSPLLRGKENTWAAGVVHAIGSGNFLFDASQTPHCKAPAIYEFFGVAAGTGQNKSKEIQKLLDIHFGAWQWQLPERIANNSLVWMVRVNGFIVDIRKMPRSAQEQAFQMGLIPFVPDAKD